MDEAKVRIVVPPELENGTYSDVVAVWSNQYGFTLDFAVLGSVRDSESGEREAPANVVARIKVSPQVVFQIARAIADNVDAWERRHGAISPP